MWMRVLILLKSNRYFGPLINILFAMVKDLVTFILLYGIIFWIFLCISLLGFGDQEGFSTMYKAARLSLPTHPFGWRHGPQLDWRRRQGRVGDTKLSPRVRIRMNRSFFLGRALSWNQ